MAKKQGICRNIDCDNYKQIVEIEAGEEFECPLCHQHLDETGSGGAKKKKGGGGGPNMKIIGIIAAALIILAGVGYGVYSLVGSSKIEKIKLDKKSLTLKVGERELLTASVEPEGAKATFLWKSSDKAVVDVVGGELTALKKGKATITVKVEENQELRAVTCKVEVKESEGTQEDPNKDKSKEVLMTGLSINSSDFSLNIGETKQLGYQATPTQNDETVTWSTSDPKIATVSSSGLVTAVGAGTATITVLSDKSMKEAIVKVTVTAKEKTKTTGGGNTGGAGSEVTSGTLKLSYGTYTGQIKNGYPNGQGRLKYSTSRQINKYDSKGRMANPGDVVQGTFVNGFITIGKHYNASGDLIESLNIGTVDGVYEQK